MSNLEKKEQDKKAEGGPGTELVQEKNDRIYVDAESVVSEAIPERKLQWPQAAALLLTEYVVLAILAFPSSYAALGMLGGILSTLIIGLATLWTSHVLWRYCMLHPEIRDICDAAYCLTGYRWSWWAAFVGLALNNWAIMGLHVNAGGTAIQTIRQGGDCTLIWGGTLLAIMFVGSLLRDLKHMSLLGLIASSTMFICTMIVLIGHGVQGTPNGFIPGKTEITISVGAPPGTSFVAAVSALLNITYTWVGQALIPSFVGEHSHSPLFSQLIMNALHLTPSFTISVDAGDMENPADFPKALYASMVAEFALFTITGIVVYAYAGNELTTAPAYGTLIERLGKPAAGMTLPTIIIVGILYSLVTSRAIFFQIFKEGSIHRTSHTFKGWLVWIAVVLGGWIISFIIGEAVPFFNDLLSLISALFDSWFGFIFWGFAWYEINRGKMFKGTFQSWEFFLATLMNIAGVFFFVAGTYAAIQSIINSYATGNIKTPFTCANSGFTFTR